jgi:muramoyltetrapeptide carboxypeptidase
MVIDFNALILPPPLRSGDLVMVVSSSGALKELAAFEKGLEIWRSRGYRVELAPHWQAQVSCLGKS